MAGVAEAEIGNQETRAKNGVESEVRVVVGRREFTGIGGSSGGQEVESAEMCMRQGLEEEDRTGKIRKGQDRTGLSVCLFTFFLGGGLVYSILGCSRNS